MGRVPGTISWFSADVVINVPSQAAACDMCQTYLPNRLLANSFSPIYQPHLFETIMSKPGFHDFPIRVSTPAQILNITFFPQSDTCSVMMKTVHYFGYTERSQQINPLINMLIIKQLLFILYSFQIALQPQIPSHIHFLKHAYSIEIRHSSTIASFLPWIILSSKEK